MHKCIPLLASSLISMPKSTFNTYICTYVSSCWTDRFLMLGSVIDLGCSGPEKNSFRRDKVPLIQIRGNLGTKLPLHLLGYFMSTVVVVVGKVTRCVFEKGAQNVAQPFL
jgi:hypothetical protein